MSGSTRGDTVTQPARAQVIEGERTFAISCSSKNKCKEAPQMLEFVPKRLLAAAAVFFWSFPVLGAADAPAKEKRTVAFLHGLIPHHHAHRGHGHHRDGCFITTSPQHAAKGIRHWRSPCPHHDRKHLNPYHPHHRRHNPLPTHSPHHHG